MCEISEYFPGDTPLIAATSRVEIIMNNGILIAGLILTISFVPRSRSCLHGKTGDGLSLANCTNLNYHEIPKLPADIQVVDLSKNPNLELRRYFLLDYADTLVRLILRENAYVRRHSYGGPGGEPLDVFSKLTNLEEFDFSASELESNHQWVLPKALKKYSVNDNLYRFLDVHWCDELEELSVNNNYLEELPKFHSPLPPLKILRGKGNPFDKLKLVEVARFCYLMELQLEPPDYAFLRKSEGFCDCTLLKYYAKEMEIKGLDTLLCFPAPETQKEKCSNDTLIEARKIRKTCPLLTKGTLSSSIAKILKIVFFFTLFLLLLAAVILYIIRHFHLKEWWAAHHAAQSKIKMEEEEEQSLQTQESASEGSIKEGSISSKEGSISTSE
ncbi:uncharacterized protein LOC135836168 [Planococcus citri]|uniref:uncharacterized protein LOC135836168 n=1 Tax=Planococcus citri TaxID=170843 RepID=UPI0031F99750